MQQTSKTHNIRLQVIVEAGSLEDLTLELLNDGKSRPFGKSQMFLTAIKPFWATLALLYKDFPTEQVVQALNDGNYLWSLHKQYLRERIESRNHSSSLLLPRDESGDTSRINSFPSTPSDPPRTNKELVTLQATTTSANANNAAQPVAVEVAPLPPDEKNEPFNPFGDEVIITD